MCGIFGISGTRDVAPLLIEGLARLEYRGYDSCGMAVIDDEGRLALRKGAGEVRVVAREERFEELSGLSGLGHTRWATHGRVSRVNAHPHTDSYGEVAIVHNGILENHDELRRSLGEKGHAFVSETDSEVIAHLIEEELRGADDLVAAVRGAGRALRGTYGIGVISARHPGVLIALRRESPLLVGLGDDFTCFASDPLAFAPLTDRVLYLEDGELAVVEPGGAKLLSIESGEPIERERVVLNLAERTASHDGFPDYMSKEIHENAAVARTALSLDEEEILGLVVELERAPRSILTGIGTSHYVAVMAQYVLSELGGRFFPAVSSDELPYLARFDADTHILAISQSGETYDTLKALRRAKRAGARTTAILNVPSSSMARETDHSVDQRAGAEICVLSTKSTMSQLVILHRVAITLGERSGHLDRASADAAREELEGLPSFLDELWSRSHAPLRDLALRLSVIRNWFFLGRGVHHGLALEAALKFKEVTYCHAEGMPAGALKHGTISLIDEAMHTAIFLPGPEDPELRQQGIGAVTEINARGGRVIAFQPEGCEDPIGLFESVIETPRAGRIASPLLGLMQAQLFAYYTARALGRNVDKPRSLAKSVTVG